MLIASTYAIFLLSIFDSRINIYYLTLIIAGKFEDFRNFVLKICCVRNLFAKELKLLFRIPILLEAFTLIEMTVVLLVLLAKQGMLIPKAGINMPYSYASSSLSSWVPQSRLLRLTRSS